MNERVRKSLDALRRNHALPLEDYEYLIVNRTPESIAYAAEQAVEESVCVYGNKVFIRGLIEISNHCKNDCLYCGIRRKNHRCRRYRLSLEEIMLCADKGYSLGVRTFVLQGGEDPYFDDRFLCSIIGAIKARYSDCAVTLSLGERSRQSYQRLYDAGTDRYLLRHETATPEHYQSLHPSNMSFENRMRCLFDLKEIGLATGCGFMVGSPFQTARHLATDLKFVEGFCPEMCGIGPFIPHHDTPFAKIPSGSLELTCFLLSLLRLMHPQILLPATTALGTIHADGREKGIFSGANVVMPNLSPAVARRNYSLYDNKVSADREASESISIFRATLLAKGYKLVVERGDPKRSIP